MSAFGALLEAAVRFFADLKRAERTAVFSVNVPAMFGEIAGGKAQRRGARKQTGRQTMRYRYRLNGSASMEQENVKSAEESRWRAPKVQERLIFCRKD